MRINNKIQGMIEKPSQWIDPKGPYSEIVFSTKVRLARNLQNHRFSISSTSDEKERIFSELVDDMSSVDTFNNGYLFDMKKLSSLEKEFLIERHLVSYNLCFKSDNSGAMIDNKEKVSVMLNEEDHLSIQGFACGLQLFEIFDFLNLLDDEIGMRVEYAFDRDFGYLTTSPENVGTGLRASAIIHLPALVITREVERIVRKMRKKNLFMNGLYEKSNEVKGNLFQISSGVSFGKTEGTILNLVTEGIKDIVKAERDAREVLVKNARVQMEDKIWRAYGILRYAHLLTSDEVINLSSAVRLGVGLGIIRDVTLQQLNKMLIYVQPGHLQLFYGKKMNDYERDQERGRFVKEILSFEEKR